MKGFKIYNFRSVEKLIATRKGETKFGENVNFIDSFNQLKGHSAKFVLFGIPEDIGVRGNHGKAGTSVAWQTCLKSLLNIQVNEYTSAKNLILLGEIDCKEHLEKASKLAENDPNYLVKLGELVEGIDKIVSAVVQEIVSAGKIPLITGGGHNNAFGNIKGTSEALQKPLNVLNIDAHTDLRQLEHRHSGNGFSYAISKNYLEKYAIFGLHQNYTPQYIFEEMKASENIKFQLFEYLMFSDWEKQKEQFELVIQFVSENDFGLEVDCDAIKDFPSSAKSPTGFSIEQIRCFIRMAKAKNCRYLHICEAAPNSENESQVGKALSYFVTDFMANEIIL
ncbi:formimidoylglutamase [Autumnicola musiva]|uniref:Formimidoylglutamase n=1 Tax=Autumnicola musiva TaxID=3075589 RepID=A0ABU3D3G3_9FLAO|nr:formimidoylglutamase [Zunongwangia sp. F117]MDT0676075.1 formimidoylglutamase [Zunongwangia sp. F117]